MRGLITKRLGHQPACAWRGRNQGAGVCRICSLLDSELCIWCSADPTALLRHAWGKLASRWAYEGLSIFAETPSSCNPLWLQAERSAPSTSGSWSCPAVKGASWFFFFNVCALICRISFVSEHVPKRSLCKETVAGARSSVCVPWMIQPASVQFGYPPGGSVVFLPPQL